MHVKSGVTVDSWVKIEDHCAIECTVSAGEAELQFAPDYPSSLLTIFNEAGLAKLVTAASSALAELRAQRSADSMEPGTPAE